MIVSSASIRDFNPERSKQVIGGLSTLYQKLEALRPPGFLQAMLLRQDKGDALLLSVWESRTDLEEFIQSGEGNRLNENFAKLVGDAAGEFKDYYVTWQTDAHVPTPIGCNHQAGRNRP